MTRRPAIVVQPTSHAEVQSVLRHARDRGWLVFDCSPCQVGGTAVTITPLAPGAPPCSTTSEMPVAYAPRSLIKSAAETTKVSE